MKAKPTPDDFGQYAPSGYCVRDGEVVVFGGFSVVEPNSAFMATTAVTHDVLVSADGGVTIRLSGTELPELLR